MFTVSRTFNWQCAPYKKLSPLARFKSSAQCLQHNASRRGRRRTVGTGTMDAATDDDLTQTSSADTCTHYVLYLSHKPIGHELSALSHPTGHQAIVNGHFMR